MMRIQLLSGLAVLIVTANLSCASRGRLSEVAVHYGIQLGQIERLSSERDLEDFLYGSLSTEVLPERVVGAWIVAHPDLFPGGSLAAYGVPAPSKDGRTIGFSRREVKHLGGLPSLGLNCAACHVREIPEIVPGFAPILVLGPPGLFDPYAFVGAVAVSMARSSTPEGMKGFLRPFLAGTPTAGTLAETWSRQEAELVTVIQKGVPGAAPGTLVDLPPAELEFDGKDLVPLVRGVLKLFHNIRTSLHLPVKLPPPVKSPAGPGRNDAFNLLAAAFFGAMPQVEAPAKFGIMWNLEDREWVHWDGNNNSPLSRNMAAAMGLGGPTVGDGQLIDYAAVRRQTEITERIRAPKYPWPIDRDQAWRGAALYRTHCASCHDAEGDARLIALDEVGTDPNRLKAVPVRTAELLNGWTTGRKVEGYRPREGTWRSTGKYWASDLAGVWARSPYLHNGSVRTLKDLLTQPARRPKTFRIGARAYDPDVMGLADEGRFVFDTTLPGNSNIGHDYGTNLSESEVGDLIEYLKTL